MKYRTAFAVLCLSLALGLMPGTTPGQDILGYAKKDTPAQTYVATVQAYRQQVARLGPWHVIGPFDPDQAPPVVPGAVSFARNLVDHNKRAVPWSEATADLDYCASLAYWARMVQANQVRNYLNSLLAPSADRPARVYFCRILSAPVAQKHRGTFYCSEGMQIAVHLNGKQIAVGQDRPFHVVLELRPGDNELLLQTDFARRARREFSFQCDWLQNEREPTFSLERRVMKEFDKQPPLVVVEFCRLQREIAGYHEKGELAQRRRDLLASQVLRPEALVAAADRDPLDVVLRRTHALLTDLSHRPGVPDLSGPKASLAQIEQARAKLSPADGPWWDLFVEACTLRRRIALANPLLDFDRIVFLKRNRAGFGHMCDQYFGFVAVPGGSVCMLENPFGDRPEAHDLLADSTVQNGRLKGQPLKGGSFLSLELSFDAKTLLFAWTQRATNERRWTPDSTYHIFKASTDGSGLTQLTDGAWNDFDPCLLPDGRIVFISERRGGYGRCHGREVPIYTLHGMAANGNDIIPLSYHETNEWHPSVGHNGMIVYSRWDYVDRDDEIQSFWTTYPDGRDPRSYHANYPAVRESRPWMELAIRAVPGSHKYSALAVAHHGREFGSLVLIDTSVRDDNAMSQVRRITPEVPFPESESSGQGEVFGTPWPLSEDYYLCAYSPHGSRNGFSDGLYLVDSFGNRERIYADPKIECVDPIPFRPRQSPPIIPTRTRQTLADRDGPALATGTVAINNVYDSDFEWPAGTKIGALRIVQLFPKTTPHGGDPVIGAGSQALARGVVGTVPVEPDGSAHFEVRAGIPIYFQALDDRGLAVQSMRSATYVHPGERLVCQGCHEEKWQAHRVSGHATPMALRRSPSAIQPDVEGSWPVSYPRLVQPVLDRQCVKCHMEKRAPSLSGRLSGTQPKSDSFNTLAGRVWFCSGGNGTIHNPQNRGGGSRSMAGKIGAHASSLFTLLEKGHHDVKLSPEDLHRLTLWMDCNANFYGAYHEVDRQARGELVLPKLE